MKTSTEILKEIEKAKKNISNKAEEAYSLYYEELKQALKDKGLAMYKEMKTSEKLQALNDAAIKENKKNTLQRIKIEILKDNFAQVLFSENIAIICEIWNKYEGKPYGEKTKEKITKEIEQTTGIRARIYSQYEYIHIDFFNNNIFNFWNYKGITASAIYEKDQPKQDCLDNYNKILKIDPQKIKLNYIGEYVENVDQHTKHLLELHQKAKQAEQNLVEIIREYNNATRGKIPHASKYDGIKNNIFD